MRICSPQILENGSTDQRGEAAADGSAIRSDGSSFSVIGLWRTEQGGIILTWQAVYVIMENAGPEQGCPVICSRNSPGRETIMALLLALFAIYGIALIIEKKVNDSCLASFRAVIHVNGIRGKTSVCRIMDAALREKYRVVTKTTGSTAALLHADGRETRVRRPGPANIHEQLRTIRLARKEKAEILILECMALKPELQKACREKIVRTPLAVITNVRYDHIFELGESLTEIARSLSETIPEDGVLYTADPLGGEYFGQICRERNTRLVVTARPAGGGLSLLPDGVPEENVMLALSVCRDLGLTEKEFYQALHRYQPDFGTRKRYTIHDASRRDLVFYNLFSANDPQSSLQLTRAMLGEETEKAGAVPCFLYAARYDRPDRTILFSRYFFAEFPDASVFLTGSGSSLAFKILKKEHPGLKLLRVRSAESCLSMLPEQALLIGIGNIKGAGERWLSELEKGQAV